MKKRNLEIRLAREMDLMDVTLIGVGAMIGAGIFVLTGIAAGVAGPSLILAFLLNGLVALLTAMAYAELGSCYHDAGGGYLWVKEALPKWNGFISGWMSWFAHAVACSLYALGFGAYFEFVVREMGWSLPHWGTLSPQKLLAVAVAAVFGYVNYRGASETGKIGSLVTMAKIAILAVFVGFGFKLAWGRQGVMEAFSPFFAHGFSGVLKAMGLTFIAFQGYEVIAQCSEEIKDPRRNIPRAVFLSLLIVVPIYLLVAVVALASVIPDGITAWDFLARHRETALVEVARGFFRGGGVFILVGGLISTVSALNATIFSSSRVAFAMGRDRNFPSFLGSVHPRRNTPHWSILLSLIIIVGMAVSLPIEDVASAADIMFLLLFLQVNLAMIRLRKKRPDLDRGFSTPLFPWLSWAGIAALLFLAVYMVNYSPTAWAITGVWFVTGLGVYGGYARKREVEYARKVRAIDRLSRKQYVILVCVDNPKRAAGLVRIAVAVAERHQASIVFLHVVEAAGGSRLLETAEIPEYVDPMLAEMERTAGRYGIRSRSVVELSHRVSRGIVDTALEEDCNFILLGRDQHPTFLDDIFSSLVDTVLHEAPSEVAVLHGSLGGSPVRNVLLPFSGDIHTTLAAEIAPALIDHFGCRLHLLAVLPPDLAPSDRREKTAAVQRAVRDNRLSANLVTVEAWDVVKAVQQHARHMDLLVLGAHSGGFWRLLLGRSLAQDITEQVGCPVLWIKEFEDRQPFWRSVLRPYAEKE